MRPPRPWAARLTWSARDRWKFVYRDERGVASAVSGCVTPWGALWAGWRNERARRRPGGAR
jgi:hypothetical protein